MMLDRGKWYITPSGGMLLRWKWEARRTSDGGRSCGVAWTEAQACRQAAKAAAS